MFSSVRLAWLYAQPTLEKARSTADWTRVIFQIYEVEAISAPRYLLIPCIFLPIH